MRRKHDTVTFLTDVDFSTTSQTDEIQRNPASNRAIDV